MKCHIFHAQKKVVILSGRFSVLNSGTYPECHICTCPLCGSSKVAFSQKSIKSFEQDPNIFDSESNVTPFQFSVLTILSFIKSINPLILQEQDLKPRAGHYLAKVWSLCLQRSEGPKQGHSVDKRPDEDKRCKTEIQSTVCLLFSFIYLFLFFETESPSA